MAAGMKTIIALALLLAVALLMIVLGSALFSNWWPLLGCGAFLLALLPGLACAPPSEDDADFYGSPPATGLADASYFATAVLLAAGIGTPVVQAHAQIVTPAAAALSGAGGALFYVTVLGYAWCFARPAISL